MKTNRRLMTRIFRYLIASLCVMQITVLAQAKTMPGIFNGVDRKAMNAWVDSVFNTMSQREKVSQIMIVTLNPADQKEVKKQIDHFFGKYHAGGLLLSEGTTEEHVATINYAQSKSRVPLMITLDGEWGPSMRMAEAPKFPRNMIMGAITDERLIYEYGAETARECRATGIHVNFAPVVDVNDNPKNPVIGTRSFGEDPDRVASLSIAYSKGLEDNGVLSTAKHFPGHGSTSSDSHKTLPTVKKSMSELLTCELLPFRRFFDAGLSGVMVAHLSIPAIDQSGTPMSLSPSTHQLLEKMGFDGLVFTDALTMAGAQTKESTAVKALLAGDDVLLGLPSFEKQIDDVIEAVNDGVLEWSLIEEKCRKMLRFKYALGATEYKEISTQGIVDRVNTPYAQSLIRRLVAASMTVVKNAHKAWPVMHLDKAKIAVVTMGSAEGTNSTFQDRCADYASIDRYAYNGSESVAQLQQKLHDGGYSMVIVAVHSKNAAYASAFSQIASAVKNVKAVMFVNPYQAAQFASGLRHCGSMLMAYDDNEIAQDYAAQAVFGGIGVSGRLPVTIAGVAKAGEGVSYDAIRLGYTMPEEVGVDSKLLAQVDSIAAVGIKKKAFSALQVLVARHGKVICNRNYGYTDNSKTHHAVDDETIFDLASLTKATGTLAGLMKCYDEGKFELDDKISKFIKPLDGTDKGDLTIKELLFHETGMPASLGMYSIMFDKKTYNGPILRRRRRGNNTIRTYNGFGNRTARLRTDLVSKKSGEGFEHEAAKGMFVGKAAHDTIMQRIYDIKLYANKRFRYSCLNFSLLLEAEEEMTGKSHDEFVKKNVFAPLGAYRTGYRPTEWTDAENIVATENDPFLRRQQLKGYVHDEMAAMLGGVSGNAGLFGDANDLAKLMQMWLNRGVYGGQRFLKEETVDLFLTTKSENSRRGLGFDKPNVKNVAKSYCSASTPAEVVGHTGYTGTAFWVDPKNDMIYIFLSNRVYPTRNNKAFTKVAARSHIQEAIYQNIFE